MRRAALAVLTLLLVAPAAAKEAPAPSLDVVQEPVYSVGDFWQYRVVFLAENNTQFPQDQTVRVLALEDFNGTPAYRLFTESVQDVPGDAQSGDVHATSNKTTWASRAGTKILRMEEVVDRTQASAQFRILTHRTVNWTFHEPMDLYQFPILQDDAWVVVTNATIESSTTLRTHVVGNEPREVPARWENGSVYQTSATSWLRQDTCGKSNNCTSAGEFDGIVMVSRSGNATIRDFYSPQAGNLVRREILNDTGALVEISTLRAFKYAKAPVPPGTRPDSGPSIDFSSWLPIAGAAVVGIVVALVALAVLPRLRQAKAAPEPAPPAEEPPAGSSEPPPPPPGGAPPGGNT